MNPIRKNGSAGFTLIEMMIVVAIIGILAAIALPSYTDYLKRGKLVDGTNALAGLRAKMEQYYQDNRTYDNTSGGFTPPCKSTTAAGTFTISCAPGDSSYTITATGSGSTSGFTYTIDQDGTMATTAVPSDWSNKACGWVIRKDGSCS